MDLDQVKESLREEALRLEGIAAGLKDELAGINAQQSRIVKALDALDPAPPKTRSKPSRKKAASPATIRRVFESLPDGPFKVTEVTPLFPDLSQSSVSESIRALRDGALPDVSVRMKGRDGMAFVYEKVPTS